MNKTKLEGCCFFSKNIKYETEQMIACILFWQTQEKRDIQRYED